MQDPSVLRDLLVLVAFALPVVALAERVRVPSIVGFLLAGVAIGPNALGLVRHPEEVQHLAEIGAILLLFEIGLELSLSRIRRIRVAVVVGGGLQVLATVVLTTGVGVIVGLPWPRALVFGCLVALSSTAVVLKLLKDRDELETPVGRVSLGILLFQDLAVVPLMVIVSLAGGEQGATVVSSLGRIGMSLGVLAAMVATARFVIPAVLARVAGLQNREVFTLTVALFGLGAAYLTASIGLAMALGAFLAGLVISESEYGAQALSDVLPFRALFSGIFFTSVGMLLDLSFLWGALGLVLAVAGGMILGKALITAWVARLALRRHVETSVATGLGLAQVGEFSFVVATVAISTGVVSAGDYQLFLAAAVLSLLLTPLLITLARPAGARVARLLGSEERGLREAPGRNEGRHDHAVIVGYGLTGRNLARILRAVHVPYVVLEMDGQLVQTARRDGEEIFWGDGTRHTVLEEAGVRTARVVVFLISSGVDEARGVAAARSLNRDIRIVVRTRAVEAITELTPLGATDVVVEEYEAALELFQRVMGHYRVPSNLIQAELDVMRYEGYGILRGVPKAALQLEELRFLGIQHALDLVAVEAGASAIGESPTSLDLRRKVGATVVAAVRDATAIYEFDDDFAFAEGDTVVLVGPGPALEAGAAYFKSPEDG